MAASTCCSSSVPPLPTPCPKSPPEYPDLYGKRRELAKVQMMEREIGFLEGLRFCGGKPRSFNTYKSEDSEIVSLLEVDLWKVLFQLVMDLLLQWVLTSCENAELLWLLQSIREVAVLAMALLPLLQNYLAETVAFSQYLHAQISLAADVHVLARIVQTYSFVPIVPVVQKSVTTLAIHATRPQTGLWLLTFSSLLPSLLLPGRRRGGRGLSIDLSLAIFVRKLAEFLIKFDTYRKIYKFLQAEGGKLHEDLRVWEDSRSIICTGERVFQFQARIVVFLATAKLIGRSVGDKFTNDAILVLGNTFLQHGRRYGYGFV
ncbi:hypothetical protein HHK36_005936 [Tetracentron sinense]|uniref:Uncharacterized protein n=1 Tax=Tetracentron sinense TaxID=13715 RepID=A0A834ZJG2_TETSI|nr:hypothetical protein HHK36_005936 [Tetracentron sinense]